MGLFGRKKQVEALTRDEAEDSLRSALEGPEDDPKRILKQLRKSGKDIYDWFGLEGGLHREFQAAVLSVWRRTDPCCCKNGLPSVSIMEWEQWEAPMMKDLLEVSDELDTEVLYIRTSGKHLVRDALMELEALRLLVSNPLMGMAIYFQENVFLRREFLLGAKGSVSPDSEEILQDLVDVCSSRGIQRGDIW